MNSVDVSNKSARIALKELWKQKNAEGARAHVDFSPDGKTIISQYQNGVDLLDSHTGRILQSNRTGTDDGTAVFFDNGKKIAVGGGRNRTFSILDANSLKELAKTDMPPRSSDVYSVSALPDGNRLAVAAEGLWIFDSTAKLLLEFPRLPLYPAAPTSIPFFRSVAAHPKSNTVFGGAGSVLRVFDVDTGQLKAQKKSDDFPGFAPEQVICSGNGAFISTALGDVTGSQNVHILNPTSLEIVNEKYFPHGSVNMAFSPDAAFLAICRFELDNPSKSYGPGTNKLYLMDPLTDNVLFETTLGKNRAQSMVVSPNGRHLAIGIFHEVHCFEIVNS